MDDFFSHMSQQIESEARQRVERGEDEGHKALLADIEHLLTLAKAFQFHDFLNTDYAMPKFELTKQLSNLHESVRDGKYDN